MNESPDQAPDPSARQATDGAPQRLRPSVGIAGTAVIAMANTAPTLSIGIGLGLISLDAGAAVPAMILLAVLPILGIAVAFSRLQPGRAQPRRELHLGRPHAEPVAGLPVRLGEPGGHHDLPGLRQPGMRVAGAHLRQRVPLAQRLRSCPEPDFHRPDHGRRTGGADRPDLPRAARRRRGRAAADTADHLRVPGADRLLRLRRGPRHPPGRAVVVQPVHRALGQAGRHRHHLVRLLLLGLGQRLHPHRGDP